jgi:ribonuclease P protein component
MRHTYKKAERLCSRKAIEELFNSGNTFFCYPFRVVWAVTDNPSVSPAQMAPTVPSRHFKKAVTRNLIKRRIREAYRTNKQVLYEPLGINGKRVIFLLQYTARDVVDYASIHGAVIEVLRRLSKAVEAPA